MGRDSTVRVWTETITLPTFLPAPPDRNPMFLEKRVYQGSSGRIYPLPFTDRIAEKPVDREWRAIRIENEFLRALVLPELGGRIHALLDKTNGYDLIYRQPVIKPALVGLAGPWISGGIEFNWPQHHRPATFLPVAVEIEEHADGSKTVWCSDHDPLSRMKGMHGICLHPGRACLELKVRAYNRTPFVQTFLWWANVATRVHEMYQSFFPPDVYYVADHARRSMSEYPLAKGFYYGVNYGDRARKGVPPHEVPRQFVPPHCASSQTQRRETGKSEIRNPKSEVSVYAPNDLSFYANIPTPCSYMVMGSRQDFFGGYDYRAQAGMVHVANHHVAPGKKQWTWGNHEFGYAWDRNLTARDARGEFGPYLELMAGVYTDNQPDFSFLQPGETKSWSQFWYPIQRIGPPQQVTLDAALSLRIVDCGGKRSATPLSPATSRRPTTAIQDVINCGVCVTRTFRAATIQLIAKGRKLLSIRNDLTPGKPFLHEVNLPRGVAETDLKLRVVDSAGDEIISHQSTPRVSGRVPPPATEPPAPREIAGTDELYLTGLHLEQYRHATRCPTLYWREALRRDPLDARCNNALGRWHLRRGELAAAEQHFRRAIERLTRRNANPCEGEPFYNLGLCLRYRLDSQSPIANCQSPIAHRQLPKADRQWISAPHPPARDRLLAIGDRLFAEAYAAFYKSTWNQPWAAAGFHALAELDCRRKNWSSALDHLNRSLRFNTDHTGARNLKVMVLRMLDREDEADAHLRETLALDPLDWWARMLNREKLDCDQQVKLDIAHDLARAGFELPAIAVLKTTTAREADLPTQNLGAAPLVEYTLGWLHEKLGDRRAALKHFKRAAALPPDYCFPSRLEEIAVLETAMRANPQDARAPYFLGNLLYDRRRHEEAMQLWERSAKLDRHFSVVWRNLGIGCFNIRKQPAKALAAYDRAFRANPNDARLLYERDQLWKRLGEKPARRRRELQRRFDLVRQRDDLSVELCTLYNQTGAPDKALALIRSRHFQPWEGGEGGPLGQHVRSHLALGRRALESGNASAARNHFAAALEAPMNLGEARHLLANQSHIHYWLGCALSELGEAGSAKQHWFTAANFEGDFQEMSVRTFSEMTFYSALSRERLGQKAAARKLLRELLAYARKLFRARAKIDYFATSLPTMLLFDDDLQFRQQTTALFLQAQAHLGLGQRARAVARLRAVLKRDPNHALAADLSS